MARVLLTGATGFIGKHILRTLAEQQHEVLALVRPGPEGSRSRLAALDLPGDALVAPLSGDLTLPNLGLSETDWNLALTADIIIHAGSPMRLDLNAAEAERQILQATDHLLELAKAIHSRTGLSRLVHLVGYMSPVHAGNADDAAVVDLMTQASPYERAKVLADLRVRQAAKQAGLPLTVVHPGTVIGSSRTGETEQVTGFGLMVDAVRRGLMKVAPGGADHWLPLIAVDDLARLTTRVATEPDAAGQTYYALDSNSPPMAELLRIIARELRLPPPKFSVPVPVIRSALEYGGSRLTGILPESLDFITDRHFPDAVASTATREILPAVIADLDRRLARQGLDSPARLVQRIRVNRLAGLQRSGTGTPWVILHGLFSSAEEMVPLATALGAAPVYLFDLAGFGRSPLPEHEDGLLQEHAQAIASALESIGTPVHLVGHSYGALVAARLATLCPDRVLDLHLLQPPLHRPRLPWPLPVTARYPRLTRKLLRFGVTAASLQVGFRSADEMPAGYVARVRADMTSPRVRYATSNALQTVAKGYTGIALGDIKVPVHLVWGTADPGYPVAWGEQAAKDHQHVRLTTLPYGHQFPLSHPVETAFALAKSAVTRAASPDYANQAPSPHLETGG